MDKELSDLEQLLARCNDPVRRAELEREIACISASHERFLQILAICRAIPIDDRGVLAGPVKRQELKLKPLKFNKSKARKLGRIAKNK